MPPIPAAVRAYLGLIDATVQRARDLAEHAPELPMQVVGNALQLSMKAQQRFTDLAIRGDEVINRMRGVPDEPPGWATFDDDEAAPPPSTPTVTPAAATRPRTTPAKAATPRPAPATKAPATKAPATKAPAKKAPARKVATAAAPPTGRSKGTPGSARHLSAFDLADDPGIPTGPILPD